MTDTHTDEAERLARMNESRHRTRYAEFATVSEPEPFGVETAAFIRAQAAQIATLTDALTRAEELAAALRAVNEEVQARAEAAEAALATARADALRGVAVKPLRVAVELTDENGPLVWGFPDLGHFPSGIVKLADDDYSIEGSCGECRATFEEAVAVAHKRTASLVLALIDQPAPPADNPLSVAAMREMAAKLIVYQGAWMIAGNLAGNGYNMVQQAKAIRALPLPIPPEALLAAALQVPEVRELVDVLKVIRDDKAKCPRAVDCRSVAKAALSKIGDAA